MQFISEFIKARLKYRPLAATKKIRRFIAGAHRAGLAYCPNDQGDLIHLLVNSGARCLETGFQTGSTALYMLHASQTGEVISVDWGRGSLNHIGQRNLEKIKLDKRHRLIERNSNVVIPEFFLAGERFDFIFIDGRKTFDYLAYELYLMNRMLSINGTIMFDDANMPSVRLGIKFLKRYFEFKEINYSKHHRDWRLRIWHCLIFRSFHRPYRALQKTISVENQPPELDFTFFRKL